VQKVDWREELKHLYGPSAKTVVEVEVPKMDFLMVDGQGDPNGPRFAEATEALYAVSYALKSMVKKRDGVDHAVSPLEGLWWEEGLFGFQDEEAWRRTAANRQAWKWTLMIMQPEQVSDELIEQARTGVEKKKELPALPMVRFGTFREGLAAQVLHRGPYAEEWPTVERVHRYIEERGGDPSGKHHEIYLNHPGRTAPEKLKTIIRQPFTPAEA
jgi:hypothetical protein